MSATFVADDPGVRDEKKSLPEPCNLSYPIRHLVDGRYRPSPSFHRIIAVTLHGDQVSAGPLVYEADMCHTTEIAVPKPEYIARPGHHYPFFVVGPDDP